LPLRTLSITTEKEHACPGIPVHTVDTAPEDTRDPLKALEAKFGKVNDIHGEIAHFPVAATPDSANRAITIVNALSIPPLSPANMR